MTRLSGSSKKEPTDADGNIIADPLSKLPAHTDPIVRVNDHVTIRPFRPSDAADIAYASNNRRVWDNMRDMMPSPYTEEDGANYVARTRLDDMWQQPTDWPELKGPKINTKYGIALDDRVIGGIGVNFQTDVARRTAEIGYLLGENHWGKGIMPAVLKAFVGWVWETFEQLVRLEGRVFAFNARSARVLEKAGFTFDVRLRAAVYKNGKIDDELAYSLIREGV